MYLLIVLILIIALIIGSYTDLKTREVPDWLNYGLIFIGVGIHLIYSIINWSFIPIVQCASGFFLFFIIALIMYYTGQWGGGDSKMLMALGALIGLEFIWDSFLIQYFIIILLVGIVYGLIWAVVLLFNNKKAFLKRFKKQMKNNKILHIIFLSASLLILVIAFIFNILFFWISIALYLFFYLWFVIKTIEEVCMIKEYPISKLTEGDWIVKPIKVKGRLIVGPKDLGITNEQIKELKKYKIKKVLVKEGIPFVPSFLIAYVIILILNYFQLSVLNFF